MRPVRICINSIVKTSLPPFKPLPPTESQATRPPVSSEQLLRGASTLEIDHAGQRYLLRVTRDNKLLLTK